MRAERITDVVTHHGEGAGWHPDEGVVMVVDMLAGDLVTLDGEGAVRRRHVGDVAAAWRPREGGGTVVATRRGFTAYAADGGTDWHVEAFTGDTDRMNEGTCDPHGRFWCGSMAFGGTAGAGVMWRLDRDRTVHRVETGLSVPNGMVFAPDGASAFHVDTPSGGVDTVTVDPATGALTDRRRVVEVTGGGPDGMTVDADGGLWVALWGGGAVHRLEPTGELTDVVEVDAVQVTSCAFTGPDLDTLVITTSRQDLGPDEDRWAGAVFAAQVGRRGVAPLRYGG